MTENSKSLNKKVVHVDFLSDVNEIIAPPVLHGGGKGIELVYHTGLD